MFYRLTGIYHTRYEKAQALWPIPADRWQVIAIAALAVLAPLYLSPLYLGSYLLPWLIWSSAALSLTLLMGLAGQLHFGYAAVMAIGAYSAIHLARVGLPFEMVLVASGLIAAAIGSVFGGAALRVKGLYLVMATLAMQYLVDWIIVNVPAISGGAHATLRTPEVRFLLVPIDSLAIWEYGTAVSFKNLAALLVICLALFVSFVSIGVMIAVLFGRRTRTVNKLYFADLLGAGIACAIVVFLLLWIGPPQTILLAGLILAGSGAHLAWRQGETKGLMIGGGVSALLVIGLFVPGLMPNVTPDSSKTYEEQSDLFERWGAIFRVDAYEVGPDVRLLLHDGMLGSAMYRFDGDVDSLTRFDTDPRLVPFAVEDAPRDRVMIIGAAGGNEVLASLYFGAEQIDAIELNPVTYDLVTDTFADWSGRLAENPRVNYVNGDGRSFLARADGSYDLIWYPAPDSYSATNAASSGAFVLSESYLYTSETIRDSLEHLTEDGIVAAQFGEISYDKPNRTTRYVSTAREALNELGVEDPSNHILVLTSPTEEVSVVSTILVKRTPFTDDEVAEILASTEQVTGSVIRYAPGSPVEGDPSSTVATATPEELSRFYDSYPFDVRPIADDRPFFWHFTPFADVIANFGEPIDRFDTEDSVGERVLLLLLTVAILFGTVFLLAPFFTVRKAWLTLPRKGISAIYFVTLGLGFMFFEISLIQRFVLYLGYPTYSLTVTLAAILIATGVGALLSGKVMHLGQKVIAPLAAAVTALAAFYFFLLPGITESTLSAPLAVRILITLVLLAPLGVTLGMFMPLGLARISSITTYPREYVAWGWAINGFASVTGAVLTTILGMMFGFNIVMVISLLTYYVALLALRQLMKTDAVGVASAA